MTGSIAISPTGYYSAPLFINVDDLKPAPDCVRKPLLTDFSHLQPDRSVRSYKVFMRVQYGGGDGSVSADVTTEGRALTPWQAYAGYWFTGGAVFYATCPDGYTLSRLVSSEGARPSDDDDWDPAALHPAFGFAFHWQTQKRVVHLWTRYTCTATPSPKQ